MLTSYQKENNIPLHIKQLLVRGRLRVTPDINFDGFDKKLFLQYGGVMERLKLPAVPIEYDAIQKMFRLLPQFVKKADKAELRIFRQLLQKRFDQHFQNDFETDIAEVDPDSLAALNGQGYGAEEGSSERVDLDEEIADLEAGYEALGGADDVEEGVDEYGDEFEDSYEEDEEEFEDPEDADEEDFERNRFEDEPLPELPYRMDNEIFVDEAIKELFGLEDGNVEGLYRAESPVKSDDYGWIENRKQLLLESLSAQAFRFVLPKFAIGFDENDKPYFKASEKEVATVQVLLQARMKQDKCAELMGKYAKYEKFQGSRSAKKRQIYSDKQIEMNQLRDHLDEHQKLTWAHQNKSYAFPSSIPIYAYELVQGFNAELGIITQHQSTQVEADDEFATPASKKKPVTFSIDRLMYN